MSWIQWVTVIGLYGLMIMQGWHIRKLRQANAVWAERFEAVEDSMYHIEDHVCGEDVEFSDSDAGNTAPAVH
jgi:hypothetical protein